MGSCRFIVTHMAVDAKTKIYGDEEYAQGGGRKASAQLAWALSSKNCKELFNEFYGNNSNSIKNLREMLISVGLDMNEIGEFQNHYRPHSGEDRKIFELPEKVPTADGSYVIPDLIRKESKVKDILDAKAMVRDFSDKISQSGGFMEIPFELEFPTGEKLMKNENGNYLLPIMSAHLRSGVELGDGSSTVHNYTQLYLDLYEQSIKYLDYEQKLHSKSYKDITKMNNYQKNYNDIPRKSQAIFNRLTSDIINRRFESKNNIFRDAIMSNRLNDSATAVWTSDPRLDIDQIAISEKLAQKLGVDDDKYLMVWRDPILRDGGTRYMRVKVDKNLTGCAIHPAMDKNFEGDFDGDSVGLSRIKSFKAQREAMEKFSYASNLLELGLRNEDGLHPLYMQNSLDIKVAQHYRPELKDTWDKITKNANHIQKVKEKGSLTASQISNNERKLVKELSSYYRDVYLREYGNAMCTYKDLPSHVEKLVKDCVETGAKGSLGKIKDYSKYLGISFDEDKDGNIDYSTIVDHKSTLATTFDHNNVQYATAVKAIGTGIAGMFSQRGMSALRNHCPSAALELTYPTTQAALQSKHDAIQARHNYSLLMSPARELWRGRELEKVTKEDGEVAYKVVKDRNGQPVQAKKSVWYHQMLDFYRSKDGFGLSDINIDYIADLGRSMVGEDGCMRDIEATVKEEKGSPLDRLAYGGNFKLLQEFCDDRRSLFEGEISSRFAPNVIKNNIRAVELNEEVKAFGKSDTLYKESSKPKNLYVPEVVEDDVDFEF